MKSQALFSSKDKSKKLKCRLLQFLFGALRVKEKMQHNIESMLIQQHSESTFYSVLFKLLSAGFFSLKYMYIPFLKGYILLSRETSRKPHILKIAEKNKQKNPIKIVSKHPKRGADIYGISF